MSGSPVYGTAYRTVRQAYRNTQKVGDGQDPSSDQMAEGLNLLNDMINMWQTQGLKLWLQFDLAITLTQGIALYTFGPTGTIPMSRPTRVTQGYFLDVNGQDRRPLDPPLSQQEYFTLSQVSQQGAVSQYYTAKTVNNLSVYFWQTPDAYAATGTAHLIIQQQVTNIVSLTDQMNFPPEWYMALHWGLSTQLCTGQPQSIIDRCDKMAAATFNAVNDWDVEDASTKFQPDQRMVYTTGGFK